MSRWLREHAEVITASCVVTSLILGGVLYYIFHLPS